jgi:hypothetical protein
MEKIKINKSDVFKMANRMFFYVQSLSGAPKRADIISGVWSNCLKAVWSQAKKDKKEGRCLNLVFWVKNPLYLASFCKENEVSPIYKKREAKKAYFKKAEIFNIEAVIEKMTEKAFLLLTSSGLKFWVPKTAVTINGMVASLSKWGYENCYKKAI